MAGGGRTARRSRRARGLVVGATGAATLLASACLPYDFSGDLGADITWVMDETDGGGGPVERWYVAGQAEPVAELPADEFSTPIPGNWDPSDGRWEAASSGPPGVVGEGFTVDHAPAMPTPAPVGGCGPAIAEVPGQWDEDPETDMAWFAHHGAEWQIDDQAPFDFGRPSTDQARCDAGTSDVPVPADYDGDGLTEAAVYQPDSGDWLVHGHEGVFANLTGVPIGFPAPADYDGDGTDEPAVLDPLTATLHMADGTTHVFSAVDDGSGPWPVPADYDGDGDDDPAVAEIAHEAPGAWHIAGQDPVVIPEGAWPALVRSWLIPSIIPLTFAARSCDTTLAQPSGSCPRDAVRSDYDGDRVADPVWYEDEARYDGEGLTWWWGDGPQVGYQDVPAQAMVVDADYDGDGRWAPATAHRDGTWHTDVGTFTYAPPASCLTGLTFGDIPLGHEGEPVPIHGDWDRDWDDDPGWWCPLDATWHRPGTSPLTFGTPQDRSGIVDGSEPPASALEFSVPVVGDWDGDGGDDLGVFEPTLGAFLLRADDGTVTEVSGFGYGHPFVADLDGDGRDEPVLLEAPESMQGPDDVDYVLADGTAHVPLTADLQSDLGAVQLWPALVDHDGDGDDDLAEIAIGALDTPLSGGPPAAWVRPDQEPLWLMAGSPTTWAWAVPSAYPHDSQRTTLRMEFLSRLCTADHTMFDPSCTRPVGPTSP